MGLFDFLSRKKEQGVAHQADAYQRIAQEMINSCGMSPSKALLYAEVEDGVISADLFFQQSAKGVVRFRFAPEPLRSHIYRFWEDGEEKVAPRSWVTLLFLVEGGRFSSELTYPDQLNSNEGLEDRRPRVIAEYFPGLQIDYSKPHG